jgi:hypothetical protein
MSSKPYDYNLRTEYSVCREACTRFDDVSFGLTRHEINRRRMSIKDNTGDARV